MSAPSLHIESTDSMIIMLYTNITAHINVGIGTFSV